MIKAPCHLSLSPRLALRRPHAALRHANILLITLPTSNPHPMWPTCGRPTPVESKTNPPHYLYIRNLFVPAALFRQLCSGRATEARGRNGPTLPPGGPYPRQAIISSDSIPLPPPKTSPPLPPRLGPKLLHAKITAPRPIQGAACLCHPPRPTFITPSTSTPMWPTAGRPHHSRQARSEGRKSHTVPYIRHTKYAVSLFRAEAR